MRAKGLKGYCTHKNHMGIECGNTDNLLPNRNLCRKCKSEINRDYKLNGPKNKQTIGYPEGYQYAAFINHHLKDWNPRA